MNANIRKLLILQDRDMKFLRLEDELESLDPEREATKRESLNRQQVLEQAKQHMIQLEVRRKDLDNDVEAKKEQIQKYAQQQLETRTKATVVVVAGPCSDHSSRRTRTLGRT